MTTQRKPYVRTMTPTWWQKLGFYRFYMLREGTSVLAVWFSIVLLYGVFALKGGAESWAGFVGFLQNPLVLLINVVALLAAALHKNLVRSGAEGRQYRGQQRENGAGPHRERAVGRHGRRQRGHPGRGPDLIRRKHDKSST